MRPRSTVIGISAIILLALTGCTGLDIMSSAGGTPAPTLPAPIIDAPGSDGGELGPDDGFTPVGVRLALDDDVPAITNLSPEIMDALAAAADDAAASDIVFTFTDAWRSEAYQRFLFEQAVLEYGSEEEARRWVKSADESQHVHGNAVDVATADAMDWLNRFGAAYGLCQIYANEMWHFEYVEGVTQECPAQLPDSSAG
jgi:hypothetical protein